jgi:tetratricopeptide (TPR) repeat protein
VNPSCQETTTVAPQAATPQERLQQLANQIHSMLAGEGLPRFCARCSAPCGTVRDLELEENIFSLTVPLPVCARCAFQPPFPQKPFFPLEGNLSSMAADVWAKVRPMAARVARLLNRAEAAIDGNRPTLDALLRTIAPYRRLLETFPQTTVACANDRLRKVVGPAEAQRFRAAIRHWPTFFSLNNPDEVKKSGLPFQFLTGFLEIIDGRIKQVVDEVHPEGSFVVQVGAVLLPGRRWDFDCQLLSDSSDSSFDPLKGRILQALESLPTWPVAYPFVLAVKRAVNKPPENLRQAFPLPFQNWRQRVFGPHLTYGKAAREYYEVALPPEESLGVQPEDCAAVARCLPENVPLKMLHAELLTAYRRPDEALDIWNGLAQQFPDEAEVIFRRIAWLGQCGQIERAASECQKYVVRHPRESYAYTTLSNLQFRLGLHAESLKTIDQALALREDAESFQIRAAILAEMERFPEAMSAVNTALFLNRDWALAYLLRAKLELHANNHADAIEDLNQYHRCAGKSVQSLQLQTMAMRALGRLAEAEQAYRTAIEESPQDMALRVELADFLGQSDRPESSREECDRILELSPQLAVAYAIRSAAEIEMNQFEEALRDADRAVERGAIGPKTLLIRASAKASLGRMEEALADLDACVETAPQYVLGRYHRGRLYKQREEYSLAVADFTAALEVASEWPDALVERGDALLGQGEPAEARKDFELAIKHAPTLSDAYAGRGITSLLEGKKSAALEDLNKAVLLDPQNVRGRMQRARLLLEQSDANLAKEDLDQVLAARPDFEPALWHRAHLHLQLGKFVDAQRDFDRLIEINPEMPQPFIGRSVASELAGDIVRAEEDREEARQLAPFTNEELTLSQDLLVAGAAGANEQFEKAIDVATKIINEHPEPVWEAYRLRGHANWYAENFVEALDDYTYLLEHADEPTRHDFSAHGQVLGELGEFERGLESLDRSIEIARENEDLVGLAYSLNGRGRALAALGRLEEAEEAFRESLKHRPENAWLHFNRGLMYVEQNQLNQALACLELALCVESPKLPPGKRRRAAGFIKKLRGNQESQQSNSPG